MKELCSTQKQSTKGAGDGTAHADPMQRDVMCPFCLENDFDLIGLKNHLLKGHCDIFNATELILGR